ncbi:MAG: SurA N-terminal domain-containing protein [Bacteroidales bacterium]|nr:SurA N-terminal domain-containing protein [Bacteroidales bacterium]
MGIIGNIRKHSWIAVLVVGIAIIAFIIGDLTKNRKQEAFAKLDGDEVTYDYYTSRLAQREEDYQMRGNSSYAFKENVWQEIVQERLLNKEMNALGVTVTDAEVSDMYIGRFIHPSLQQQFTNPQTGVYDRQGISNYVRQIEEAPDTMEAKVQWIKFQEQVREDRQRTKYIALLQNGMYMPKAIANKIAEMSAKQSDVRVAGMLYSQAGDIQVELTDADYQKYFDTHKKELNRDVFRMDNREQREVAYAVFTAQPSQNDMMEIQEEVNGWWNEMQTLDEGSLIDFVNMHGGYDSMYVSNEIFAAPLDTVIKGSHAGREIAPMIVPALTKDGYNRHTYGEYVMGKVLKTEMRPDSLRISLILIPSQNYHQSITRTPEQAAHLRDSAMASIKAGMPFEMAVKAFSIDTNKGGDQDWQLDGNYGILNEDIIRHNVGDVFDKELPNDGGYFIVKVTGKTSAKMKYRVALAQKVITPSNDTEKDVRDRANQFASQFSTCQAMIEGAQAQNVQMRNALLISMSDSLTGFANTRDAVRWAFNAKTISGAVSGEIYNSDYSYIVCGLREIYVPDNLTLDQARPLIENRVRLEKLGEQLAAKAEEAMKGKNDINAIAEAMNVTIDTVTGVKFGGYLGRNGMEPKAVSAIAAKQDTGIIGPIQGANGVYVISVDSNSKAENTDVDGIRQRYESAGMNGLNYVIPVLQSRIKIVDNRLLYL